MPARLQHRGAGVFVLEGELDFESVAVLWEESTSVFRRHPPARIDLVGVTRSNSAGVALLVEWLRQAKTQQWSLTFSNIPSQMQAIVRVADLEALLPD